jgi:hypothetical protein
MKKYIYICFARPQLLKVDPMREFQGAQGRVRRRAGSAGERYKRDRVAPQGF